MRGSFGGGVVIHFDGFSLLLIVTFSWVGYVIGWRRCRAGMRSQIANDASVIAQARRRA